MAGPEDRKVTVPKVANKAETKAFTGGVDKVQADFNKALKDAKSLLSNAKKEDKLVITGLTSKTPMPTSSDEKRAWLHKIVGEILDKIIPESSKHVIFSSLGNRNSKIIPLVEVKMDSRDLAMKIRREFSALYPPL